MSLLLPKTHAATVTGLVILVSACGGGGSSKTQTGDAQAPDTPTLTTKITATNAPQVAAHALDAAGAISHTQGGSGGTPARGLAAIESSAAVGSLPLQDLIRRQLELAPAASGLLERAVAPASSPCDTVGGQAGTQSHSMTDTDRNGVLSQGDVLVSSFSNCSLDGVIFNGAMSTTITALTGILYQPGSRWQLAGDLTVTRFAITDAMGTISMSGDMSMNMSSADGITERGELRTSSLTTTFGGTTDRLVGFVQTFTDNSATGVNTFTVAGTVDSQLYGVFSIATPQEFSAVGDGYPSTGKLEITGDRSRLTLEALSGDSTRLQVDADGDGTFESTREISWSVLETL